MNSGSAPSETVSIIIPTHNRAKLLPDAVNSALTQGEHVTVAPAGLGQLIKLAGIATACRLILLIGPHARSFIL